MSRSDEVGGDYPSQPCDSPQPSRENLPVTSPGVWEVEVASQGANMEEALLNLREALELCFEDQPLPNHVETPIIATVDIPA
jgi:hypothetical protein